MKGGELTTGDKHIPLQPGPLPPVPLLAGGSAGELAARSILATKQGGREGQLKIPELPQISHAASST